MNNTRFLFIFGMCTGLLLLGECATSPIALTGSVPATTPVSPATTIAPKTTTIPPTLPFTATPRKFGPTSTHFPTSTPPPVLPTPANPYPTLTGEQERTYVERMLATNGSCELPCWWGINTGEATLSTLENFGAFYSEPFPQRDGTVFYGVGDYQLATSDGNLDYYTGIELINLNGKILAIKVHGESHNPHGGFVKAWQRYSVDQVLSRYGIPTAVRIQLSPRSEPGASLGHALTLVYDYLGIVINYSGEATDGSRSDFIRACPFLTNVIDIDLKFQSPKTSTRFPLLRLTDPGHDRSLQEATGMSLDDFYNKFKNPSNQACLEGEPTLPQ
jgi:hypothetical protein